MSKRTPEDRASSCAFLFADGRRCRMLRSSHFEYCFYHAHKIHRREVDQILRELAEPLSGSSAPATALTQILSRVCTSLAEGRIAPKQANAIARAANVLLKSISKSAAQCR
jgi:uncharacterized protein YejL (UPF0352 family)